MQKNILPIINTLKLSYLQLKNTITIHTNNYCRLHRTLKVEVEVEEVDIVIIIAVVVK